MISIIILIGVAIVIVAIKEITMRKIEKNSKYLIEHEKATDERTKKLSRNSVVQLVSKSSWFHIIFFVSALVGGAMLNGRLILPILYIVLMAFLVIWGIVQHRKAYESLGVVEQYLASQNKGDLQRVVNSEESNLSKKEKHFLKHYNIVEKRIGIVTTIVTAIQLVISIVLWIGTF